MHDESKGEVLTYFRHISKSNGYASRIHLACNGVVFSIYLSQICVYACEYNSLYRIHRQEVNRENFLKCDL